MSRRTVEHSIFEGRASTEIGDVAMPTSAPAATLGAYMTPLWASEALVRRKFGDLTSSDVVLDPCCGTGSFLGAIPENVEAIGVEIDPHLACIARKRSGRHVIVGDFRTVPLDVRPTVMLTNPPFANDLIEQFLNRAYELMPVGGRAGMVLSGMLYSDASRVLRFNEKWSLAIDMLPRYIYPRLSVPLVFGLFTKDEKRTIVGFSLYCEMDAVQRVPKRLQRFLREGAKDPWKVLVGEVLAIIGRPATLDEIMEYVEPIKSAFRPANNTARDTVRRECGAHFKTDKEGVFAKAA